MRPRLFLRIVLLAVVSVTAPLLFLARPAQAYQYVQDGSFEDGTSPWSTSGGVLSAVDGSVVPPVDGEFSGRVEIDGSGAFAVRQTATGLGPGDYQLRFSARQTNRQSQVYVEMTPYNHQNAGPIQYWLEQRSDAWISGVVDLPLAQFSNVAIKIIGTGAPGDVVFIDGITLDGAPPVTATDTGTPTTTNTPTPTVTFTPSRTPTFTRTPSATHTPRASETAVATASTGGDPPRAAGETLRNGGFESSSDGAPADWLRYGGALSWASSPTHSGAGAARFESDTDSTKWMYQVVAINGGSSYSFAAWVLDDDPSVKSVYLRVSWYESDDGTGSAIFAADSDSRIDAPAADFRLLTTGAVMAPASARSARLRVMLAPISGEAASIYVDDAEFRPEDSAEAALPSAAGSTAGVTASDSAAPSLDGALVGRSRLIAASDAASAPTGVVINEVLYDADISGGDAEGEWVELYNGGDAPTALHGWRLTDSSTSDALPDIMIQARAFVLIAASDSLRDAYPEVGDAVVVLDGRIGNSLGNDGDSLSLIDAAGVMVDAVSWGTDRTVLDPPIDDVPAGHSIERRIAGGDSNTASDFVDNNAPSPGRAFVPVGASTKPAPHEPPAHTSINVLASSGGSSRLVLWLAMTLAGAALVAGAGWRALPLVSQRLRHHP